MLTGVQVAQRVQLPDSCRHLRWNGDRLIAACDDGTLMAGGHPSESMHHLFDLGSAPTTLSAGPEQVVCGAMNGALHTIACASAGAALPDRPRGTIAASACVGAHLVVAHGEVIEVITDPLHAPVNPGVGLITGIEAVTRSMAVITGATGIAWYDVALGAHDGRLVLPTIVAAATDPQGRCVALGDLGGSIHVVRAGAEEATELTGYPDRVALLDWLSSGRGLCAVADDEVTLWQPDETGLVYQDEPAQLAEHDVAITALGASEHHDLLATGDASGVVKVWAPLWVTLPVGSVHIEGVVLALAWRPDGRALAMSSSLGELALVEVDPRVAI